MCWIIRLDSGTYYWKHARFYTEPRERFCFAKANAYKFLSPEAAQSEAELMGLRGFTVEVYTAH